MENSMKINKFRDFFKILFVKFGFSLVCFSCIPSLNLLLCLKLVKKFSVVVVVGGGGRWC